MTVTFLGEKPGTRTATNTEGVRTYERTYLLSASSPTDDEYAVGSNANLPLIGSLHPSDPFAWCRSLTVKCTDGYKAWEVKAAWSSQAEKNENPTDDAAQITWGGDLFQEPFLQDRDGNAVLNSAGDPYDPPLMKDATRAVVNIVKRMSSVPDWILSYRNKENDAAFTLDGISVATGVAKIQQIDVGIVERQNDIEYRTVTIVMHLDENGWNAKPPDMGFRELNDNGDPVDIVNKGDSAPITMPALLDGAGKSIPNATPSDAIYGDFTRYQTADFSALPLT